MITKEDIIKAKEYAKTMASIDSDGITTPKGEDEINIKAKYYGGYVAACEDKNKEIAKYKKLYKGLLRTAAIKNGKRTTGKTKRRPS
jgi:hypothetical protein